MALHRCVVKFADYQLDWPALWRDLELYFVDKPIWKTNFLILHDILPTADRLACWGIEPRHTSCHCGQPESQEHLYEHCPLTLILVDWFEELLGRKWPNYRLSNAHIPFGHPASAGFLAGFKFLLATLRHYTFGLLGIRGNFRVLNQIPKCWSRRSSLLSGLSRRYNSEFFDQRFTRKNGSLGECCSLWCRSLVALATPAVCGRSFFQVRSARWPGNRPCYLACNREV